jgi:hypothetical protein
VTRHYIRALPAVVLTMLLLAPCDAVAQAPQEPKVAGAFLDVGLIGSMSSTAQPREFTARFVTFGENGRSIVTYPKPSREIQLPNVDVGAGYIFANRFGLAVNFSRVTFEDGAELSITVPHPQVLGAAGTGTSGLNRSLSRKETMLAVNSVMVPLRTSGAEARFFLGAAYFWLNAEMVNSLTYSQTAVAAPIANAVEVTGFTTLEGRGRSVGISAGGDFTRFFTPSLGVSAGLRYSRANVTMAREPLSQIEQKVRVGGFTWLIGARYRFGG